MDSKLLVGLIKEVVKNEVKQQVKEELAKLSLAQQKQLEERLQDVQSETEMVVLLRLP